MDVSTTVHRWIAINEKHKLLWSNIFLCAVCLSFVVSDWMLGLFTFSEYILGGTVFLMILIGQFRISTNQLKWISMLFVFFVVHLGLQETLNDLFVLKTGIAAFIKLMFYIIVICGLYNYIFKYGLKKQFLKYNNILAILACLIGWYITFAIYSENIFPYEFFWAFTRSDTPSYVFNNGIISFVRTKSLFSEPSYFGFYLNTILTMNLFNSDEIKINKWFIAIIIFTTFLTVSYSAIGIMVFIIVLYIITTKRNLLKWSWKKGVFLTLALIMMAIIYILFSDFINHAFIQRTIDIFTDTNNSGYSRLFGSWKYVDGDNFMLGNGLGHTPSIWNIYAYMLSDLGLFGLLIFIMLTFIILRRNFKIGIIFILLNFSKGGYLSSSFWLLMLLVFVFSKKKEHPQLLFNT